MELLLIANMCKKSNTFQKKHLIHNQKCYEGEVHVKSGKDWEEQKLMKIEQDPLVFFVFFNFK